MQSYVPPDHAFTLDDIPDSHWTFVRSNLHDWFETDTHVFVHANLHPDKRLNEQVTDWLHWQPNEQVLAQAARVWKTMICGHTSSEAVCRCASSGRSALTPWAYGDGWLTCLDVETNEYWQANEFGQTRNGSAVSSRPTAGSCRRSCHRSPATGAHKNAPTSVELIEEADGVDPDPRPTGLESIHTTWPAFAGCVGRVGPNGPTPR